MFRIPFAGDPAARLCACTLLVVAAAACSDDPVAAPTPPAALRPATLTVSPAQEHITPGDTVRLLATVFNVAGDTMPTTGVSWSSSNPEIATVDANGLVTGLGQGDVEITATDSGLQGSAQLAVQEYVVCDCAVIVDSTEIRLVSADTTTGVYVFEVLRGTPPVFEAGQILVGAEANGFIRRVLSSTTSGRLITVLTEQGYLEEVLEFGSFSSSAQFFDDGSSFVTASDPRYGGIPIVFGPTELVYMAEGLSQAAPGEFTFDDSGLTGEICKSSAGVTRAVGFNWGPVFADKEFKKNDPEVQPDTTQPRDTVNRPDSASKTNRQPLQACVTVAAGFERGRLTFKPRLDVGGKISWFQLRRFHAVFVGQLDFEADEFFEFGVSLKKAVQASGFNVKGRNILEFSKPFYFQVGPVPVAGRVILGLKPILTAEATAKVRLESSSEAHFRVETGVRYSRGSGWRGVFGAPSDFDQGPIEMSFPGTAEVKLSMAPDLQVEFYGVGGPFCNIQPYARMAAFFELYRLYGHMGFGIGLDASCGARLSALGFLSNVETGFNWELVPPYTLWEDFSKGSIGTQVEATGADFPTGWDVEVTPVYNLVQPPWGSSVSGANQRVRMPGNGPHLVTGIRADPDYEHQIRLASMAGNCTATHPPDSVPDELNDPARDTVAVTSNLFAASWGWRDTIDYHVHCVPFGALEVVTETDGEDPDPDGYDVRLTWVDSVDASAPLFEDDNPIAFEQAINATQLIDSLIPRNPNNSGEHIVQLRDVRPNCAAAHPDGQSVVAISDEVTRVLVPVRCIELGALKTLVTVTDDDPPPLSGTPNQSLQLFRAQAGKTTPDTAVSAAPNDTTRVGDLIPLYNASGADGAWIGRLDGGTRCSQNAPAGSVTVLSGDTAHLSLTSHCRERLRVATRHGAGPVPPEMELWIDGVPAAPAVSPLGANDSRPVLGLTNGAHQLELRTGSCTAANNPRTVTLSSLEHVLSEFVVDCPVPVGNIRVATTTTGAAPDPDGYRLAVDGRNSGSVAANGTASLGPLGVGPHTVRLSDVAGNCTVQGGAVQTVEVRAGEITPVTFVVDCPQQFGSIAVSVSSSGNAPDTDGYRLRVDSRPEVPIAIQGSLVVDSLLVGTHTVTLVDVAPQCSIAGPNPRLVRVNANAVASVAFTVVCSITPPTGDLNVDVTTTGADLDPDGYQVLVDGVLSQAVGTNGTTTFSGLATGSHSVELQGVAANCTVAAPNPTTVSVPGGSAATHTFAVTCTAIPTFGDMVLEVNTSGPADPDGYLATVDGTIAQTVEANGEVTFVGLTSGSHSVLLTDIAPNCTVQGTNPRTFTVAASTVTIVTINLACAEEER